MVSFRRKGIFKVADIWFASKREKVSEQNCDFAFYHNSQLSLNEIPYGAIVKPYKTLVTSLIPSPNDIFSNFKSKVKNEIRRAIKDGVIVKMYTSEMLVKDSSIISEFDDQHTLLFRAKGLHTNKKRKMLMAYARIGVLYISVSYYEKIPISFHVYISTGKIVRLLHSVSPFRNLNNHIGASQIGRANRFQHFFDMKYFRSLGCETYDWGGYSDSSHLQSVARFKAGFNGEVSPISSCIIACNFYSRMVIFALKKLRITLL